ncbi:cyclic-phosphate processing receiver domain-containing protein [Curtobacterium sp. MCBD17_040]|uniref:cyclic-phosphate processing receiver domain-containing protein n=1 Tax=Curtobacterium sp. MCBD17_040 TaxID=2175674 RepID=UPI000DA73B00|nr:cyclic-phosphate processing receiver domain-containing protein [Curtobacterium sp. MCBD17_040]WIB65482.1 hypothetical protein DEI94_19100 [Curtobacterium sp. MCBD17_040]
MPTPVTLWIDDERPMPPGFNAVARTSAEALNLVHEAHDRGYPLQVVSFDHDLGGDDTTRPVMLWMAEHDIWPDEVRVHTANPVGRDWLEGIAARYAPTSTRIVVAPVTGR